MTDVVGQTARDPDVIVDELEAVIEQYGHVRIHRDDLKVVIAEFHRLRLRVEACQEGLRSTWAATGLSDGEAWGRYLEEVVASMRAALVEAYEALRPQVRLRSIDHARLTGHELAVIRRAFEQVGHALK